MTAMTVLRFLGNWLILSVGCSVVFGKAIARASREWESGEVGDESERSARAE